MTSHLRAVQREAILSRPPLTKLSKEDKILLSNTLSFFQEEPRLKNYELLSTLLRLQQVSSMSRLQETGQAENRVSANTLSP